MNNADLMAKVVRQRMGDYSKHDIVSDRQKLVQLWRDAHPEAVNQPPSEAHRPLMLLSKKPPGAPESDADEIWANDIYQVVLRRKPDKVFGTKEMIQLGINTHDGTARHDWREFQWIKNQLAGPECEAFELYPKESRLYDPSNYYTLWCFPHLNLIKVGVNDGRRVWDAHEAMAPQRGFPK